MQFCYNHHIEMRDVFKDKIIVASLESFNTLVSDDDVAKFNNRDIDKLQKAIEDEGGCQCCYYFKHFNRNLVLRTKERLRL